MSGRQPADEEWGANGLCLALIPSVNGPGKQCGAVVIAAPFEAGAFA